MSARVTVVHRALNMDLIRTYWPDRVAIAAPCPNFVDGLVFAIRGANPTKPDGFCVFAWMAIERTVRLACTDEHLVPENQFHPFPCCSAGFRPVTFHVEPIRDT